MPEFTRCPDTIWFRNRWDTHEYSKTLEMEFVNPFMSMLRVHRLNKPFDGLVVFQVVGPDEGAGARADWKRIIGSLKDRKAGVVFRDLILLIEAASDLDQVVDLFDRWDPESRDVALQVVRWLLDKSSADLRAQTHQKYFLQFGSPAHKLLLKLKDLPPGTIDLDTPSGQEVSKFWKMLEKADLVSDLDDAIGQELDRVHVRAC